MINQLEIKIRSKLRLIRQIRNQHKKFSVDISVKIDLHQNLYCYTHITNIYFDDRFFFAWFFSNKNDAHRTRRLYW